MAIKRWKLQTASVEDEDMDDDVLPSGWDSLPWSPGYKKAMQRADDQILERRRQLDERGIIGDGKGTSFRREGSVETEEE